MWLVNPGSFKMEQLNPVYNVLSDKAKAVAPKIESLLVGLSIEDACRLLSRVKMAISESTKVGA